MYQTQPTPSFLTMLGVCGTEFWYDHILVWSPQRWHLYSLEWWWKNSGSTWMRLEKGLAVLIAPCRNYNIFWFSVSPHSPEFSSQYLSWFCLVLADLFPLSLGFHFMVSFVVSKVLLTFFPAVISFPFSILYYFSKNTKVKDQYFYLFCF